MSSRLRQIERIERRIQRLEMLLFHLRQERGRLSIHNSKVLVDLAAAKRELEFLRKGGGVNDSRGDKSFFEPGGAGQ